GGGQELVPIGTVSGGACPGALAGEAFPAWANGWQYFRVRIEGSFERFFWSPHHRTWRVQKKNGVTIELGGPLDGNRDTNALETDPSNASHVFRWNAVRQFDANGGSAPVNVVRYRYQTVGNTSYLTDIWDTPPASSAATAPASAYAHHVHLAYEQRTD